ncbi:DUF397 domain-containing protein [Streptomyces sp. BH-SS-21]|uniref:DUF397 domain-containing protein n=1 Tax=Streptomyces liliiviolaceus TaxID=2823109 RepID=A0A941B698_9ACTN|nr:DUF397 domain-containing protein [Streptomyces liliiviolaceus]MBQ0848682.1 DUF397 domain-containing protein [Streptomyces liliiviolaceus]
MHATDWQKSTYSGDGSNCVCVAATPAGTVALRESDAPDTTLITTRARLGELIRSLKTFESRAQADSRGTGAE